MASFEHVALEAMFRQTDRNRQTQPVQAANPSSERAKTTAARTVDPLRTAAFLPAGERTAYLKAHM